VSLVGIPVDEGLVVIASNWGQTHYPAWYHNVKASPEVKVGQNGRSATYIAREVEGAERERYWQLANQYYIGFSHYARHASHRRIPVILLMPR
jgi:deazaflavin-dependent oxidoreductase (nitroreductase family)